MFKIILEQQLQTEEEYFGTFFKLVEMPFVPRQGDIIFHDTDNLNDLEVSKISWWESAPEAIFVDCTPVQEKHIEDLTLEASSFSNNGWLRCDNDKSPVEIFEKLHGQQESPEP